MPRISTHGRFLVSLSFALTLIAVPAAPARAGQPADPKPADRGTFLKNLGESCGSLRQFGADLGEFGISLLEASAHFSPPADPHHSMLIHVVDSAGKPVAGATVMPCRVILSEANAVEENRISREGGWGQTFTAADGSARIARPTTKHNGIVVQVEAQGYVASSAEWSQTGETYEAAPPEFTFKLDRSRAVGGLVRDPSGRPVAGAHVILSLPHDGNDARVRTNVERHEEQTNQRGRWRCGHLPSRLDGLTVSVTHDEHVELVLDEQTCAAQRTDLQSEKAVFVMEKGLVVEGTITDVNGKPVLRASVNLPRASASTMICYPEATTDENGHYRIANCVPGKNTIVISAKGLAWQHRDVDIQPGMKPADFRLEPAPDVKLRVADATGKPLAGARVERDTLGAIPFNADNPPIALLGITGADGRWSSDGKPEGDVLLEISKPGYATVHQRFTAGEREYLITLRPPVCLSGRVLDAVTKRPVRNAYLSASPLRSGHEPTAYVCPTVLLDAEGRYTLTFSDMRGADQVAWQLRVQSPGYVTQLSRQFKTQEGSRTLDIELPPGKAVSGVVKRPDGSPVAGAKVFAATASNPWTVNDGRVDEGVSVPLVCVRTAADGRFRLPMPLEPYVVGVVHELGGAEITASELGARGEIVLRPWARVEGVIQGPRDPDAEGKQTVYLNVGGNTPSGANQQDKRPWIDWSCSTDPDQSGRFAFERVLPGRREVHPSSFRFSVVDQECVDDWRPQVCEAVAGHTARIQFARKGRPVTGHAALPARGSRKVAVAGGDGCLLFQRPLIPPAGGAGREPADARKEWEKQWLESEAGKAADRAGQNHLVPDRGRRRLQGRERCPRRLQACHRSLWRCRQTGRARRSGRLVGSGGHGSRGGRPA